MAREIPITFECENDRLCGIFHQPSEPHHIGMIVVVGGPQYRVGSHRQFVILARFLANHGIPVMRFDYRGMGDSEGEPRTFEKIDDDVRNAIDSMEERTGIQKFVLWGLCDGATAASFYAHKDARVVGLVLVNPWVRSETSLAKAYLKHYYFTRVLDRNLWSSIFHGKFGWRNAVSGLLDNIRRSSPSDDNECVKNGGPENSANPSIVYLEQQMHEALEQYSGDVLILLSGNDMTAAEFAAATGRSWKWKKLLSSPHYQSVSIPEADHTFSTSASRVEAEKLTLAWIQKL